MKFVYQNIPRCDDRTFLKACQEWLYLAIDPPPKRADTEAWNKFLAEKIDLEDLPDGTMIFGDLVGPGITPMERYGDEIQRGELKLLTLMRDPLDRALTMYAARKARMDTTLPELPQFLAKQNNGICALLNARDQDPVAFFSSYFFVAIKERLEESIRTFAGLIGESEVVIEEQQQEARDFDLTEEMRESFRRKNAADYALYAAASAHLDQRRKELERLCQN